MLVIILIIGWDGSNIIIDGHIVIIGHMYISLSSHMDHIDFSITFQLLFTMQVLFHTMTMHML